MHNSDSFFITVANDTECLLVPRGCIILVNYWFMLTQHLLSQGVTKHGENFSPISIYEYIQLLSEKAVWDKLPWVITIKSLILMITCYTNKKKQWNYHYQSKSHVSLRNVIFSDIH